MLRGNVSGEAPLEFRLLGPLEVWRDGNQVRLGGERQRSLLALLLLNANELVTTDRLVEEIFGAPNGEEGLRSLRVAISRLRRLLDHGNGGQVLVTRPGGYVAHVEPGQLDVGRFQDLVEHSRRAAAQADLLTASVKLREALSLWRGPPLADLSALDFAQSDIRRLEELRLVATMDRFDADLALGRHAELIGELEALVDLHPLQERARGQLMLALYRSGRQADALAVYRQTSELLRNELGLEPSRALQELEHAVLRQAPALELTSEPAPARPAVCPFKGLASFERADAEYFCGRERLVTELIALAASESLVGLVGPSGVGKSSALRAGLLAALTKGALPGSSEWRQVVLRPGDDPLGALERALGGRTLSAALGEMPPGQRLVIAVDQLEELFTSSDPDTCDAFLTELLVGVRDPERCLVVVTLRADFYGRSVSHPAFARRLNRAHVLVGPMDRSELRRAIEEPARRAGLQVEPALSEALLVDLEGQPGGLPLLSTALLELWRLREGNVLTYEIYRSRGGVGGAVARLAEAAFMSLDGADQAIARRVLLRLTMGDEGSLARRRLPLAQLEREPSVPPVIAVLTAERLLTVSDDEVEISHEALLREWPRYRAWIDEERVERRLHAHLSASAREWEGHGHDRADLYRGARLAAALEWSNHHADEITPTEREFLVAAQRQAEFEENRQRTQNRRLRGLLAGVGILLVLALAATVVAVINQHSASSAARRALARQLGAEAVSEPRIDLAMLLAREAVRLDPSPQTQGTLLATLLRAPAALASFSLPIDARPQSVAISPDGRTLAVADNDENIRLYDTRSHAERAVLHDAWEIDPPAFTRNGSMLLYLAKHPNSATAPYLAVRDVHDLALLRRLKLDRRTATGLTTDNPTGSLLVSPDNRTAYYGYWLFNSAGGAAEAYMDRWSLHTGRLVGVTKLGAGPLLAMRLTAEGHELVVLRPGRADVYDAGSMRRRSSVAFQAGRGNEPPAAAISQDGRAATFGSVTGSVSFVNLVTGRVTLGIGGHSSSVDEAVYSPNGRLAVTTGEDEKVIVWDTRTGAQLETLVGHGGPVHGAAISDDGQTLFTSSLDGQVLEWDLGSYRRFGRPFDVGPGYADPTGNAPLTPPLAMAPDGSEFAIRLGAGRVGLFSTSGLSERASFQIPSRQQPVTALAFSPRGQLAVGGRSGAVGLWTLTPRPHLVRSLIGLRSANGPPEAIQTMAFGRGGSLLAAADINHPTPTALPEGHLAIWRTATGRLLRPPLNLHQPGGASAFSPDGRYLAVGLGNGVVWIIDPVTGQVDRRLRPIGVADRDQVVSLAFAPDGTLATGSWAGTVQLWNPATGQALAHPLLAAAAPVASIDFDPSGQRFSTTGGSDGTAKLWFTASLQQEASLQGDDGHWGNAVFSPDGRSLTVVYEDGRGFRWPTSLGAWIHHACSVADRNLTREEWDRFAIGHAYARVCP
jgi:WD40 repeat protein/DNA-binding SARP family transcriptional activator